MKEKLKIGQVLLVEGRYDASRLAGLVDGLILTTDGFAIFKDKEKQALLRTLGRQRGVLILTDSDAAGFRIRRFVSDLVGRQYVSQAYVPAIPGKESRKAAPGKEGLLGVEGVPDALILQGLQTALDTVPPQGQPPCGDDRITYTDLYEWGLSGSANASQRKREFLQRLGLPLRLSKKELIQVLNTLYTRESLQRQLAQMDLPGSAAETGEEEMDLTKKEGECFR